MNQMPITKRAQILGLLVKGMSINATCRVSGAAKATVLKLLSDVGAACAEYQDKALRNLTCKRLQLDEIWSFVNAKQRNVPEEKRGVFGFGDVWTWTAIDADTKLIAAWMVGRRNADAAHDFIGDLAGRLSNRVQITTDGLKVYVNAIESAFGSDVDYATLVKVFGEAPEGQRRYSPPQIIGEERTVIEGTPDMKHVSTSYLELQNLTKRMGMRRFTRPTNGFSKKVENHVHAIALHFMHYNFGRIHKTLRVTPAMEAGISDHVWSLKEIAALVPEPEVKKRGTYKKKQAAYQSSDSP